MVYFLCKVYDSDRQNCYFAQSLPVRGAWIEIYDDASWRTVSVPSLPVRGAWIEIEFPPREEESDMSLPVRGAWIEILLAAVISSALPVAPRAGSVD